MAFTHLNLQSGALLEFLADGQCLLWLWPHWSSSFHPSLPSQKDGWIIWNPRESFWKVGSRGVDFSKIEMRVDHGVSAHPCTELVIRGHLQIQIWSLYFQILHPFLSIFMRLMRKRIQKHIVNIVLTGSAAGLQLIPFSSCKWSKIKQKQNTIINATKTYLKSKAT